MPSIRLSNFGGVVPRYNRALRTVPAKVAENVKLWHGTLEPFREPRVETTVSGSACAKTIFRYGCCWLAWDDCCVSVAGGLQDCPRLFVTGWKRFGYPVTALLPADGSCAFNWKRLGVPKPAPPYSPWMPPLETPAGAPIAGVQIKRETRNWVVTYVNSFGEEGPPSDPFSIDFDADEGAATTVWAPPPPAGQGWDVVAARLYRVGTGFDSTGTGDHFGEFFFVGELPIAGQAVSFTDSLRSDELGEPLQTRFFYPPPADLQGIVSTPEGGLAGFVGATLWMSEPYNFHAWPCSHVLDDNIAGLVWSAGSLYVLTDGAPYIVGEPERATRCLRPIKRYSESLPCVSAKSIAATATGCIYASRAGLVRMIGDAAQVDSHALVAEDDWAKILPHTMIGAVWTGRYFGFTNKIGFIYDFRDGVYHDGDTSNNAGWTTLTLTPTAIHRTRDDHLFMAFAQRAGMEGVVIAEFDAGAAFMPYRWRSRDHIEAGHMNFAAMKVVLEQFAFPRRAGTEVKVSIIADDREAFSRTINWSRGFRVPHGMRHYDFQIEVSGREEVREIHLATSMHELAENGEQ